jgi:hypothetical protein
LILRDQVRIVQQAPDQGGFSVVDRTASEKPEKILTRLLDGKCGAIHQK